VSTGRPGFDTPNGTFWALARDKDHKSNEYEDAPMPYSIFFTRTGIAVHGTKSKGLGKPVSHGCVRLSVEHAAALWDLVATQPLYSTVVQVNGSIPQSGQRIAKR
jgi:lipoprotein-anchoring transpeptidase ErfK/SrfK